MKRIWICLLLAGMVAPRVVSQAAPAARLTDAQASVAKQEPFTNQLRKTVAFLHVNFDKPGGPVGIEGTAFFVLYDDARLPAGRGLVYLVTNRHMAAPESDLGETRHVNRYDLTLNFTHQPPTPNAIVSRVLPLTVTPERPWYFPDDKSIDLAVIPVNTDAVPADFEAIPVSQFAQEFRQSVLLAPGYQVVFAGFFYQFPGFQKIQPIVRQGILAMMPDEPVPTVIQNLLGSVFLVDAHSYHGNSGSPIFVNAGGLHGNTFMGGDMYRLLGVVSGYYPEHDDGTISSARVLTGAVHDNSGITIVVPVEQLKALLDIPKLREGREKRIQGYLASQTPKP